MRTGVAVVAIALSPALALVVVHGCLPYAAEDCETRHNCPSTSDDAGPMADGADVTLEGKSEGSPAHDSNEGSVSADGSTCDPTKSPRDEPCMVDNAYGVFVSSGGRDIATGTMSDPLKTIAGGITTAIETGKSRVYVCDGTYPEQVALSSAVNLYGAFACDAGWSYVDGGAAQVVSAPNQIALIVNGVSAPITVEDLRFAAADASGQDDGGNGMSSTAALVNASTVTFRRCIFIAGNGADGANGSAGSNYMGDAAPNGQPADDAGAGGAGGRNNCNDGTSSFGGRGGNGGTPSGTNGDDGGASPLPTAAAGYDGQGGASGMASCGAGAHPGANGAAGTAGGAQTPGYYGSLTNQGWTPSAGGNGGNGNPAQGGGGGGGIGTPLLGGTGGGAGGCGGAGGTGGGGGGASIGIACVSANVTLEGCVISTVSGGKGGQGGAAQPGQGGGIPGPPPSFGCSGGGGGNGAGGAGGGGGTGGFSVCVVFKGNAPSGAVNCTKGDAGAPGSGGAGAAGGTNAIGSGPTGPDGGIGLAGLAAPTWQSP
jgi:hypothetical protein